MTQLVVDASVTVKWLVLEELSREARILGNADVEMVAPGHWRTEMLNALWKKLVVKAEVDRAQFDAMLPLALDMPMAEVPAADLLEAAVDLAVRFERTVYDSLCLALAERLDCQFVTADRRLYNATHERFQRITWLGDIEQILPGT